MYCTYSSSRIIANCITRPKVNRWKSGDTQRIRSSSIRNNDFNHARSFSTQFTSEKKDIKNNSYQVIIVGAGHNGLVTAAYLAKKGLKVLVLEKRHVVGGAAVTEELIPGFKFSRCSYLSGLFRPQIIEDLELKRHGLKFYARNPSSFTPVLNWKKDDQRYLLLGPDGEMNRKEIAKFSLKDAEVFPKYEAMLERISQMFETLLDKEPPNFFGSSSTPFSEKLAQAISLIEVGRQAALLGKDIPNLVELLTAPASKILNRWFESEPLISTLATDSIIGAMLAPSSPGSGYVLLHHVMGITEGHRGIWSYVEGGMGGISNAIAKSAAEKGVKIVTDCGVKEINVDGSGKATGVTLEDGSYIPAEMCVVSNATPQVTFTKLCPKDKLPNEFFNRVKNIDYKSGVTKINVALNALPNFKAYPNNADNTPGPQHRGTIHICKDMDEIETAFTESLQGKPSTRPVIEMTIPSSLDPTIAPKGQHVATMFIQYTPYELKNGKSWKDEKVKEEFADRVFSIVDEYAPGFSKSVVGRDILSPYDLEQIFGLTGGNIFHGSMSLDQLYWMRPVPGFANYTTPIKNLFMCGSGAHPGGGVMGAAGRNCAHKILNDFKK